MLHQTVVCFSFWSGRFCASVPAASEKEPRSGQANACQNTLRRWSRGLAGRVNLLSKMTLFCRPIMTPSLRDGRTVGEEPQPDQPAGRTIPILSMQIIPGCLSIAVR